MRKLKLQMQVSLDGFNSTGPNDDQSWVTWAFEEIRPHVIQLADSSDTILIGRGLAVDYIPYWQDVLTKPDDPMHEIAERVVSFKKYVFTKTLKKNDPAVGAWKNTELASGNLVDEVNKLKKQSGKDIMVYGGSSFVANLVKEGLIDEYHFFVNPVVLGQGVPIFHKINSRQDLGLKNIITYNCGIVMLHYEPKV
jgi:dihydrofolate reductase